MWRRVKVPANRALFCPASRRVRIPDAASGGWYARASRDPRRGAAEPPWSTPIEPTATDSGTTSPRRLRDTLNETTYETWFAAAGGGSLNDGVFVVVVPNDFTREWIENHFLGLLRAATKDSLGREVRVALTVAETPVEPVEPVRPTSPTSSSATPGDAARGEPEVHVRQLRDRVVEPVRARRGARGRRGARAGVQPALHLRRHGPRQDAPPAGDRRVRQRPREEADHALRHERDVHERLHQLAARQAHRGLQAPLPRVRRPARRRHPVPRGQGAVPGGVLPHLQLALRGGPADRDLVRPAAEGDRHARGAAALALRVGADHRHPAARPRDAHRDPPQEGDDRRRSPSPIRRC